MLYHKYNCTLLQVPDLQYPCVVKKGNVLYVILKDQATISLRHAEAKAKNNKRDQEGKTEILYWHNNLCHTQLASLCQVANPECSSNHRLQQLLWPCWHSATFDTSFFPRWLKCMQLARAHPTMSCIPQNTQHSNGTEIDCTTYLVSCLPTSHVWSPVADLLVRYHIWCCTIFVITIAHHWDVQ